MISRWRFLHLLCHLCYRISLRNKDTLTKAYIQNIAWVTTNISHCLRLCSFSPCNPVKNLRFWRVHSVLIYSCPEEIKPQWLL